MVNTSPTVLPLLEPVDVAQRFADAWNARDATALAALFVEDADFVNVVGLWWRKRRDIRKAHDYGLKTFFRSAWLTVEEVRLRRIGESAAVVHALCRLEGQYGPDGTVADARRSILVFVLQNIDADWRVVAAQNTEVVPGAETFVADTDSRRPVDYRDRAGGGVSE